MYNSTQTTPTHRYFRNLTFFFIVTIFSIIPQYTVIDVEILSCFVNWNLLNFYMPNYILHCINIFHSNNKFSEIPHILLNGFILWNEMQLYSFDDEICCHIDPIRHIDTVTVDLVQMWVFFFYRVIQNMLWFYTTKKCSAIQNFFYYYLYTKRKM